MNFRDILINDWYKLVLPSPIEHILNAKVQLSIILQSERFDSTGPARDVLHVLRLGDHDDREALPDPVEDHRSDNVGDRARPDRLVPPADLLRWSGPPAKVDRLGHDPLRGELVHLFHAALHLRRSADKAERAAVQWWHPQRRGQRDERHEPRARESMQVPRPA